MSIILELRGHYKHAGLTLVHENSEDVVVGNVFGTLKNFRRDLCHLAMAFTRHRSPAKQSRTRHYPLLGEPEAFRLVGKRARQRSMLLLKGQRPWFS